MLGSEEGALSPAPLSLPAPARLWHVACGIQPGLPTSWPRRRAFPLFLPCPWGELGRLKPGWKRWKGGFIQSGTGSESSSGALFPSRGEVRRIKVTDGPAIGRERHMCSCVPGKERGGRGHQGLTTQTGETSLMAYEADKVHPESGGRAVEPYEVTFLNVTHISFHPPSCLPVSFFLFPP